MAIVFGPDIVDTTPAIININKKNSTTDPTINPSMDAKKNLKNFGGFWAVVFLA